MNIPESEYGWCLMLNSYISLNMCVLFMYIYTNIPCLYKMLAATIAIGTIWWRFKKFTFLSSTPRIAGNYVNVSGESKQSNSKNRPNRTVCLQASIEKLQTASNIRLIRASLTRLFFKREFRICIKKNHINKSYYFYISSFF